MHHHPDLLRRLGAEIHADLAARAERHRSVVRPAERARMRERLRGLGGDGAQPTRRS